jgi:DNA excision repair protein ERCC-2
MKFDLDGLEVFFPYDRMYVEQYQYMRSLKQILDAGGHGLLEMPTGTGKTVCLLSLITSYQYAHPGTGKLVYATRTVPEMNHVMQELSVVLSYRAQCLNQQASRQGQSDDHTPSSSGVRKKPRRVYSNTTNASMGPSSNDSGAGGSGVLALCLSSRRNMCINRRVVEESDREAVDAACRSLTASWVLEARKRGDRVETCEFYDQFISIGEATSLPSGVYDLEALQAWGKQKGWCPYYLTRQAINHAHILVFNYQYLLDAKVRWLSLS